MSTGFASIPLLKAAPEPDQVAERLEGGPWAGMELALLPRHVADDAALDAAARAALKRDPDLRAVIQADGAVPHASVIHALDRLRLAGLSKVAFATQPPPETGP